MPFRHAKYGYLGVVTGWDTICRASAEWIEKMQVDTLACGRNQPFYHAVADDGSERYVAEDNIQPASFTVQDAQSLYAHSRQIALHFEDVQLPDEPERGVGHSKGRGRFLLNPHTRQTYPNDEAIATKWVNEGRTA
ncbi:Hemimethylated DNA-binding domain-containing protein [Panaeolus papilionaceus]|nr:Hemimethylated DNA-binding domain-containing protein [Panaeolus papilionaceus]